MQLPLPDCGWKQDVQIFLALIKCWCLHTEPVMGNRPVISACHLSECEQALNKYMLGMMLVFQASGRTNTSGNDISVTDLDVLLFW